MLALKAEEISQELLTVLLSLARKVDGTRYKSWTQAIRTIWTAGKIKETHQRLQNIRDELQFRILVSIKEDHMHGLDEASRKVLVDIIDVNKSLITNIRMQAHQIHSQQKIESGLAAARHQELLDAISSQNVTAPDVDTIVSKLLSKLYFHRQDDRFEDIAEAHQKTFTWVFENQQPSRNRSEFLKWLQQDSGTYWISGKAGSGKSTLMKYLAQNPRLKHSLQQWAGDEDLVIATFYFWQAGAPMQRSQTGLLRSLLWQVLSQQPTLGSRLFPDQYVHGAVWTEFPTFNQLRKAFSRFTNHVASSAMVPTKVVFIVDGLDEFENDTINFTGLADMFLLPSQSSNIKALVSSRPLPAFESCFQSIPKIRLHELTQGDVTAFVEAELVPHLQDNSISVHDSSNDTEYLIDEIVAAASGVFLWVKLVVQSLIEGVKNGDTTEDLRFRLKALPKDLEDLFDHMLLNILDMYKVQSSQIFQLVRIHQDACPSRSFTAINLLHAISVDESSILGASISTMPFVERKKVEKAVDRRLKSRCVGLLELRTRILDRYQLDKDHVFEEETHQDIVYLHRTVADYLARPDVWSKISSWTKGIDFNAPRALLQSLVMKLKTTKFFLGLGEIYLSGRTPLWPIVEDAMALAQLAERTGKVPISALLLEFDKLVAFHFVKSSYYESPTIRQSVRNSSNWHDYYFGFCNKKGAHESPLMHHNLLALMVTHGLVYSVAEMLSRYDHISLAKKGRPLLHHACAPGIGFREVLLPSMLQILLDNGADPNQVFDKQSAWQHALKAYKDAPFEWISALTLLVKHGANPNACIDGNNERQSALRVVKARFDSFLQGRMDNIGCTPVVVYLMSQAVQIPTCTNTAESLTRVMSSRHKADLRLLRDMVLDLIKLLESKGAKEQAWRKEKGDYIKIGRFGAWYPRLFARRYLNGSTKEESAKKTDVNGLWSII